MPRAYVILSHPKKGQKVNGVGQWGVSGYLRIPEDETDALGLVLGFYMSFLEDRFERRNQEFGFNLKKSTETKGNIDEEPGSRTSIENNIIGKSTVVTMTTLRWGICSAGRICEDFVNALATLPPDDHRVQAVAARNVDSAKKFAEQYGIPKFYSDYESMFTDKDVDIIYIGTINSAHEDAVMGALEGGKHVLCEKVLGVNAKECKRMITKAREKGLFLMEAYWTRFFPAMLKLREEIAGGAIGDPKIFNSNFGYPLTGNVLSLECGGGATTGIGCYLPMMAQYAFFSNSPVERPVKIVADGTLNEQGVDKTVTVSIHYSNERLATFVYTIAMELNHDAFIAGNKGILKIPDHSWSPETIISPTGTYHFPLPPNNQKFNFPHSVGLRYEAEHVRQCLLNGHRESPLMTLEETLILAEINDEIRRQVDVRFPQDDV